jgi:OmcA/MtrC family decaheme c-type cytochrome
VLAIHGGGRHEVKFCQACHNPRLEVKQAGTGYPGWDNASLMNLAHRIHNHLTPGAQNLEPDLEDFSEVTYPPDIRNCTRCHQGPDAAGYSNWKNKPTAYAYSVTLRSAS